MKNKYIQNKERKSERPVFMITSGEAVQLIYRWKSQV